ncbi:unnamed protein product [Effrenium voratum]|nr:unnamed protein product [Effrenium voratum]
MEFCSCTGKPVHAQAVHYRAKWMICTLHISDPPASCEWWAQRRMCTIREGMLQPLQEGLGMDKYNALFADSPFPLRGGLRIPGSGLRLQHWLRKVAQAVSCQMLTAELSQAMISALAAPSFSSHELSTMTAKPWSCGKSLALPLAGDDSSPVNGYAVGKTHQVTPEMALSSQP